MTTTMPEPDQETVAQHPDYEALPKKDREEMDAVLQQVQDMQNDVDKWCGVMGGAVYFMARMLLQHELALRTIRRENRELLVRLRSLEDAIS